MKSFLIPAIILTISILWLTGCSRAHQDICRCPPALLPNCSTAESVALYNYAVPGCTNACVNYSCVSNATISLVDYFTCHNYSHGWSCQYYPAQLIQDMRQKYNDTSNRTDSLIQALREIMQQNQSTCSKLQGRWYCSGFCQPSYEHWCDLPLNDTGVVCQNSDQCEGRCLIGTDFQSGTTIMKKMFPNRKPGESVNCSNCTGKCSKYDLHPCEWWYELNNGTIEDRAQILCD